jgi:hypothetical protein
MIADALREKPNYIIVDDSSRFARLRDVAVTTKKLLRKHGMDLLYASEENVNPRRPVDGRYQGDQERGLLLGNRPQYHSWHDRQR